MKKLKALLGCLFGRHERSKGQAREIEGRLVSVCKGCGRRMVKRSNGRWELDRR